MTDLNNIYDRFSDLHTFVADESQLAAFVPAAAELQRQAAQILRGERSITPFANGGGIPIGANVPRIPEESLARGLLREIDRLPSLNLDDDPALALAYGTLLRNVSVSMMRAIFEQYPDIVPTGPSQG